MSSAIRIALCALAWSGLLLIAQADPAAPRVAVISDADNKDLAALVTTELSADSSVILVERDDLAKVGDELKLQQLAGSDAVALGKLVNADGLLFLGKGTDGLHVRFTAVGLGYAMFDDQLPAVTDATATAKSIAHRVGGYAPKLKLDPAKTTPISILNLRADYATTDSTALERKLTLLLESRLAALPTFVVLERRHAWSLGFERALAPSLPALLPGACVVDGTFGLPATGTGDFTVHLRLRSAKETAAAVSVDGSTGDLPGLVEKIIAEIQKSTGSAAAPSEWQPQKEAREYLQEGIWGWQHKADHEALEALDSAELLGEKSPDLLVVRANVLCDLARDELKIQNEILIFPAEPFKMPAEQRAQLILRAIQDTTRYVAAKPDPNAIPADPATANAVRYADPTSATIPLASNILVVLDRDAPAQADQVRDALRPLTGYDPLHGTMGPYYARGYVVTRDLLAKEWPKTLEEQVASYRLLCTDPKEWLPESFTANGKGFCTRFLKTPEEQAAGFAKFVDSLKDIPAARVPYLIMKSSSPNATEADEGYRAFIDELWNRRDEFSQIEGYQPPYASARRIPKEIRERNAAASLPLLHYVLTHRNTFVRAEPPMEILWVPNGWTDADAPSIWSDYLGFKQRIHGILEAKGMRKESIDDWFKSYDESFQKKFPLVAVTAPVPVEISTAPPLTVTRYWYPWISGAGQPAYFIYRAILPDDDGVWVTGQHGGSSTELYHVTLPDFATQSIPSPGEKFYPESMVALNDAIYATWQLHTGEPGQISRLDRKTLTWATQGLPDYFSCRLYNVENSIYCFVSTHFAGNDETIERYDWAQNKLAMLSSTRRRPAQSQFDDRARILYAEIYPGPGHKPCVTTEDGTFYIQETPGQWPTVFDSSRTNQAVTTFGKTLVVSTSGEITLLDSDKPEPIYLMAATEPIFRRPTPPGTPPVKESTPWAAQTIWDAPPGERLFFGRMGFHDNRLYVLLDPKTKGGNYRLLAYEMGGKQTPREIPLEFHLNDKARAVLSKPIPNTPSKWDVSQYEHPDTTSYPAPGIQIFCATKQGLLIHPWNVGFWFLPYADIDAYLKAH